MYFSSNNLNATLSFYFRFRILNKDRKIVYPYWNLTTKPNSESGVKVPISVLGAETDQFAPKELVEQFELALKAKPEVLGSMSYMLLLTSYNYMFSWNN